MNGNVKRVRFLIKRFIQGRLARAIKFQGQGFLCANRILSDRLYNRHAVHGSIYRFLLSVLFHCPIRRTTTSIVVRIRVGVQRESAIQVRRALRRRIVLGQIGLYSARAMNRYQAYHQTASQSS